MAYGISNFYISRNALQNAVDSVSIQLLSYSFDENHATVAENAKHLLNYYFEESKGFSFSDEVVVSIQYGKSKATDAVSGMGLRLFVDAKTNINNPLLKIIGSTGVFTGFDKVDQQAIKELRIIALSEVVEFFSGIELSLVVDISGSMEMGNYKPGARSGKWFNFLSSYKFLIDELEKVASYFSLLPTDDIVISVIPFGYSVNFGENVDYMHLVAKESGGYNKVDPNYVTVPYPTDAMHQNMLANSSSFSSSALTLLEDLNRETKKLNLKQTYSGCLEIAAVHPNYRINGGKGTIIRNVFDPVTSINYNSVDVFGVYDFDLQHMLNLAPQ